MLARRVWLSFGTYTTFSNISVISWRSVLKVEKTGVAGEKPPTMKATTSDFKKKTCFADVEP
jgi:hypothetical protein